MNQIKEYTLSRNIANDFYLSPHEILSCDKYYILYWSGRYIYTQLLARPRIVRESISYTPHFLCGLCELDLQREPESQYKLSFRRLKGQRTGYVLITRIGNQK